MPLWDRPVERGVEDGHLRNAWQSASGLLDRGERGPVVERRDRLERPDRRLDRVVDERRLDEARAAVDDPVRDRIDPPASSSESTARRPSSGQTRWSFRLVEPALTTSTSPTAGPGPAADRRVSAPCSRVQHGHGGARVIAWRRLPARRGGPARGRSRPSRGGSGRGRSASPCRRASSSCPPPCSRARGCWRGSSAGTRAGGSARGSRGRRRRSACRW